RVCGGAGDDMPLGAVDGAEREKGEARIVGHATEGDEHMFAWSGGAGSQATRTESPASPPPADDVVLTIFCAPRMAAGDTLLQERKDPGAVVVTHVAGDDDRVDERDAVAAKRRREGA